MQIIPLLLLWFLSLNAYACYPTLSISDAENLEIAVQMIEGYLGKPSPISVKRLPSQHSITHFTNRCLLTNIQTPEHIKALLQDNKITIEKDNAKGTRVYKLGITKRPDIEDFIAVSFPDRPDLELLHQILPLDITLTRKELQASTTNTIEAFYNIIDLSLIPNSSRTLLIRCPSDNHVGEKEWSKRLTLACHSLGWSCVTVHFKQNHIVPKRISRAIYTAIADSLNPDYCICVMYQMPYIDLGLINQFLYLTEKPDSFCSPSNIPTSLGQNALLYSGLIDSNPNQLWLNEFSKANHQDIKILNGYPSTHQTPFREPELKGIFYCGVNWDSGRSSPESKLLFKGLEQMGLMHVYGPPHCWQHLGSSYKGFIPIDGISMLDRIHECGVGLCIHWDQHLNAGIPMSRFFEICAAGAVAICDNHPWIREHFGDDVLFFDHTQPWENRVKEIKAHFDWIQSHPDEAKAMAKRAHAKFVEKYAIQVTLKQIEQLCEGQTE